jgi:cytochrome P450
MDEEIVDFAVDPLPGDELHALMADLREQRRVAPVKFAGTDALLITRFEDVHDAFADSERLPGGAFYQGGIEPVVGRTFISMDGKEHDLYRKLTTPAFRSRAVARFDEEALVPLTNEVIGRFAEWGAADLIAELTSVLPFTAITRKLGIPQNREDNMREWAEGMLTFPFDPEGAVRAAAEFSTQLEPILTARRDDPKDDVFSELVQAEMDGTKLTDDDVYSTVRLLYAVGATTTSHAMGNMLSTLLRRPEMLERAYADEGYRAGVVHELLRWEGPLGVLPRLAPHDTRIAGVPVPAGTFLLFGLASANRDPRVWEDPDTFDPTRSPEDILTFGFGNKFCPGSHLARRELLTTLTMLLERLPGLHLIDEEGTDPSGAVLRHPTALHVMWETE